MRLTVIRPNEHELEKIVRQLVGPRPTLYCPVVPVANAYKTGARVIVTPTWQDLTGHSPQLDEFWSLLRRLPMPGSIVVIAMLNLLVCRRSYNDQIHATFCRDLLAPERLAELKRFLQRGPQSDAHNLVTRGGLLLLLRLALAFATESGERTEPRQILGDLILMVNEYALGGGARDENRLKDAGTVTWLVEMLPTWEVVNPPELAYGLSRAYRMLQMLLHASDPLVQHLRASLPIDFSTITFDGLLVEDYIGRVFGIHAYLNGLDIKELLKGDTNVVIDTTQLLSKVHFPTALLDNFVAARSRTVAELGFEVAPTSRDGSAGLAACLSSDAFISDQRVLRRFPLCRLDETHIVCLDAPFLVELVIYGLYWRILDALAGNRKDGDTFLALWGRLFELYLGEMLLHHYPKSILSPLRLDVTYDGGQIDALLDFGDDVLIFEFKGSLLKNDAKLNRDSAAFKKEFALKFIQNQEGAPKALRQLASASAAAAKGALGAAPSPTRIYPVIVGYEPCLEGFCVNAYADDEFQNFLDPELRSRVRPLTTMSVETFEAVIAYTSAGEFSWPELLERRFDGDNKVKFYSVSQAIYDWRTAGGQEPKRNEFMLQGLHRAMDGVLRRYRGDAEPS